MSSTDCDAPGTDSLPSIAAGYICAPEPPELHSCSSPSSSSQFQATPSQDAPILVGKSSLDMIEPMRLQDLNNAITDMRSPTPLAQHTHQEGPILLQWAQFTSFIHNAIANAVVALSKLAAENPKTVVTISVLTALALPVIGWFTNFRMETEQEAILAPYNSLSRQHHDWIENDSNFPSSTRPFDLLIHQDGDNVLSISTFKKVFEALDVFQSTEGYDEICSVSDYELLDGRNTCQIHAATRFWRHNESNFEAEVRSEEELIAVLSQEKYPGDTPVGDRDFILGNNEVAEIQGDNGTFSETLVSAQSYIIRIEVPVVPRKTSEFEDVVVEILLKLRQQWEDDDNVNASLEFFTFRSIPNEFERAIVLDLPLYPAVFFIMCGFTCITFFRKDRVHSRCLLGVGAVVTIGLSLLAGCGLMFVIGVPLTNLTGSLAFVVFGVGLDDTFIIMGEYSRTDPRKTPKQRVVETVEVVGLSIFVTTLTTMTAFALGTMSEVPAIRWLCYYALPTIFIDFLLQTTCFISLLVLDERRVQANKQDCCFCCIVDRRAKERELTKKSESNSKSPEAGQGQNHGPVATDQAQRLPSTSESSEGYISIPPKSYQEQFMVTYVDFLMKGWVKAVVIVIFVVYLGLAMYSATLLEQEFKAEDIVPNDSYVTGFLHSANEYSVQVIPVGAYFRNVDQSEEGIQQQMRDYIYDLGNLTQLGESPPFCWVTDFVQFEQQKEELAETAGTLTFQQKLDFALSIPAIKEVYGSDIVRDGETGNVTASRCWFFMKNMTVAEVDEQTHMLESQRNVSRSHPVSKGQSEFAFFSFSIWYIIWEFYTVAINELILTTISGIVAVSIVAFLFIPHWTAVLFVSPLITTLYIDLLGTLQFAGVKVNVVTYVCLVISVGLLVDFLMHLLLRYYESHGQTREDKVRDTLESMGPSILVGGLSTLLGVVPLAFSTNDVTKVVFDSFIAMVSLGIAHGLIFLPVVLSLVGPTNIRPRTPKRVEKGYMEKPTQQQTGGSERLSEIVAESVAAESAPNIEPTIETSGRDKPPTPDSEESKIEEDGDIGVAY